MGKSVTATLMGILIKQGVYELTQPAPIPEWQAPGDPRAKIRIADILHMSSGIRIKAPQDPDYDPNGHLSRPSLSLHGPRQLVPVRGHASAAVAAQHGRPLPQHRSGAHQLPRSASASRNAARTTSRSRSARSSTRSASGTMVMETDPYGNFLTQGYEFMSGRDWARLGNLYLQDGVWNGERILPEGFAKFVSTVAPAWAADKRPDLRRLLLDQRRRRVPGAEGGVLHVRRRRPDHADHPVARSRRRAPRPLQGQHRGSSGFKKALALLMDAVPQEIADDADLTRAADDADYADTRLGICCCETLLSRAHRCHCAWHARSDVGAKHRRQVEVADCRRSPRRWFCGALSVGRHPVGAIVVQDGSCYIQIMSSDVPSFVEATPAGEQMKAALLSTYIVYSGPCVVDESAGSLTLTVEAAWRPDISAPTRSDLSFRQREADLRPGTKFRSRNRRKPYSPFDARAPVVANATPEDVMLTSPVRSLGISGCPRKCTITSTRRRPLRFADQRWTCIGCESTVGSHH